ncbi:hypothetical protein [Ilyobacter sp.]|uniref:hypothetical protein n=1 Tax=Ilyobacter sp. TaxID=3100343 RepID=UPI0035646074
MKANLYDKLMSILENIKLNVERKDLLRGIHGKIIKLGSGTGANFKFYGNCEVIAVKSCEVLSTES